MPLQIETFIAREVVDDISHDLTFIEAQPRQVIILVEERGDELQVARDRRQNSSRVIRHHGYSVTRGLWFGNGESVIDRVRGFAFWVDFFTRGSAPWPRSVVTDGVGTVLDGDGMHTVVDTTTASERACCRNT